MRGLSLKLDNHEDSESDKDKTPKAPKTWFIPKKFTDEEIKEKSRLKFMLRIFGQAPERRKQEDLLLLADHIAKVSYFKDRGL